MFRSYGQLTEMGVNSLRERWVLQLHTYMSAMFIRWGLHAWSP